MSGKIEILAPAGSQESLVAAVRSGADAVYIGAQSFSARASAANFSDAEIFEAAKYCHSRGVKLHLALNTLVRDEEIDEALRLVKTACEAGVDALIIQDLGLARLVKKAAVDMPLHASTQMTVHTPQGAKTMYDLGFQRVVLARELSHDEIREIVDACPIETEVFVHGALCMSVSGQCEFSALLGGRSGNRGRCAQPCRLPFKVSGGNGYALSLKDLSLLDYLKEIEDIGVTSAKIEGRMKRPEYVAAATDACVAALDNKLDSERKIALESVFSRSGFTQGYYCGKIDSSMFGFRSKENVTSADSALMSRLKQLYKNERQSLPLKFKLTIKKGAVARLEAESGCFKACAEGKIPDKAEKVELSKDRATAQLSKTGGTQFYIESVETDIDGGLAYSMSSLNAMRRSCIEQLSESYCSGYEKNFNVPKLNLANPYRAKYKSPKLRVRLTSTEIPTELIDAELVYVPLFSPVSKVKALIGEGFSVGVEIPRCIFGKEEQVIKRLSEVADIGVRDALVSNIGVVELATSAGLSAHGSFALSAFNTETLWELQDLGLSDIELSQELNIQQMAALGGEIGRGAVVCGKLPLMITRACPAKNAGKNCKICDRHRYIVDRKSNRLELKCDGITTEVLNPVTTYANDILDGAGFLDFLTLRFSTESRQEIIELYTAVKNKEHLSGNYTNGMYKRGVI